MSTFCSENLSTFSSESLFTLCSEVSDDVVVVVDKASMSQTQVTFVLVKLATEHPLWFVYALPTTADKHIFIHVYIFIYRLVYIDFMYTYMII